MGYNKKKPTLWGLIVVMLFIALCFKIDYTVWRLQHPEAPAWTYILK
jgi:predicted ferric reductase